MEEVNGLHDGIGPPPPGTLLYRLEATTEVLEAEPPAARAATTRVRAEMRTISFIINLLL